MRMYFFFINVEQSNIKVMKSNIPLHFLNTTVTYNVLKLAVHCKYNIVSSNKLHTSLARKLLTSHPIMDTSPLIQPRTQLYHFLPSAIPLKKQYK